MTFLAVLGAIGLFFWGMLKEWLAAIFLAPWQNFDMLWVLVPIYLGWVVADFFQEKRGTSLGNAISNGVVPLWAGIDWTRTTIRYLATGQVHLSFWIAASRFLLAACVLAYGLWIIYDGIKARPLTRYIGRVRTVSYFVILFTPVFYNVTPLTLSFIAAVFLFFWPFYFLIEWIDLHTPDPDSIAEENGGGKRDDNPFGTTNNNSPMGNDPFGRGPGF